MAYQDAQVDEASITRMLGGDPAHTAIGAALALAVGAPALIAALWAIDVGLGTLIFRPAAVVVALLAVLALPIALWQVPTSLANRRRFLRAAVGMVRGGHLGASWGFQGESGGGIVVVDEPHRRLFVHDGLYAFSDVKAVEWSMSGRHASLQIVLRSGENPVRVMRMSSRAEAARLGHRLLNTLASEQV